MGARQNLLPTLDLAPLLQLPKNHQAPIERGCRLRLMKTIGVSGVMGIMRTLPSFIVGDILEENHFSVPHDEFFRRLNGRSSSGMY